MQHTLSETGMGLVEANLCKAQHRWLVTGCAGFIGSNLTEFLLKNNQIVVGLDNFATGHRHNLEKIKEEVGPRAFERFEFREDTIENLDACQKATTNIDFVLHQAAIGSVPRSLERPIYSHQANVNGFMNMIFAAKENKVKRFVYASSSSVYGSSTKLPKEESDIGEPLSPYAATKYIDEVYAKVFARCYQMPVIGLRYFNVFGKRQDPDGPYAAVIPKWIKSLMQGQSIAIYGDGETSRDFTYIANTVQVNLLAAFSNEAACNEVYNVAVGQRSTLNELSQIICDMMRERGFKIPAENILRKDFRAGDVRHSLADISKASRLLGYLPTHQMRSGLEECIDWYVKNL